jgi:glycosyltransferase involved in cell wall biosynthesis
MQRIPTTAAARRLHLAMYTRRPPDEHGGVERVVRGVTEQVRARFPDLSVSIVAAFRGATAVEGLDGANDVIAALRLAVRLLREDARVVFVHCPECVWALRLARRLRPRRRTALVAVWHGAGPHPARVLRPHGDARARLLGWFRTLQERGALGADAHVAVHQSVVEDLQRHHGFRGSVSVVENALAPEDLEHLAALRRPVRAGPVALWMGQTEHRKGLDVALSALRRARRRCPDLRLIVAGVRPGPPTPGVEWRGVLPPQRALDLYGEADVLLFPTRYESFGLVVLEAMAAGLPVVVSDALPAGIAADDRNGRVIRGHDPDEYAEALVELLADPERLRQVGERNRQDARRFSLADAARSYAELAATLC